MIFAAASALIKQPGLITWGSCLLLNFILLWKREQRTFFQTINELLPMALTSAAIVGFWYVPRQIMAMQGNEASCLGIVYSRAAEDISQNYWQALLIRLKGPGYFLALLPSIIFALFITKSILRTWFSTFAIPYLLISLFYGDAGGFSRYITPAYIPLSVALGCCGFR